jgi:hypothetical protein
MPRPANPSSSFTLSTDTLSVNTNFKLVGFTTIILVNSLPHCAVHQDNYVIFARIKFAFTVLSAQNPPTFDPVYQ